MKFDLNDKLLMFVVTVKLLVFSDVVIV